MKAFRVAAVTLALGTSLAVAPGLANANKRHPGHTNATPTGNAPAHTTKYVFRGIVVATPGAGATGVTVQVRSGNPAALKLEGTTAWYNQTFAFAPTTQLFSWNTAGTSATPATSANLLAGDPVAVTIWGASKASLAQVLATPASRVDDVLNSTKPAGRMFIFVGQVVAADATAQAVTVNVVGGNWRSMFALRGQATTQTFHWSATSTVFLNHAKGTRAVTPATINTGDTVVIRIFSADYNNELSTLLNIPAWRISNHMPARLVQQEIRMHNQHKL